MEKSKSKWKICCEEGKCYTCSQPVAKKDSGYCEFHLKKRRDYERTRRKEKCPWCGGKQQIAGHCNECWEKKKSIQREKFKKRKESKKCPTCGVLTIDYIYCEKCRDKTRLSSAKKRSVWLDSGLCGRCGKKQVKNMNWCEECFLKELSVRQFGNNKRVNFLLEIFEYQKQVCPYTGIKLILGVNASLDHRIPKSRGGTDEKDNLQWVYYSKFLDINRMKRDMNDEEFKEAINILYKHQQSKGKNELSFL